VAGAAGMVIAIDDLGRKHRVDVVLDQNWTGPETVTRYDHVRATRLLGTRHGLLQPAYAEVRASALAGRDAAHGVLVSFGGSDPTSETERVLEAVASLGGEAPVVHAILGGAASGLDRLTEMASRLPRVTLHTDLPTLAPLLATCHLAIGAGGTSTWERICLGVPSRTVTVAGNQVEVTRTLAAAGLTTWLGHGGQITMTEYAEALRTPPGPRPTPLSDGLGAGRVAAVLAPAPSARISVRPATGFDDHLLLGPDTGDHSYLAGPSAWSHWAERAAVARATLVIALDGVTIGAAIREHDTVTWWAGPALRDRSAAAAAVKAACAGDITLVDAEA
jgi:UDP-2,4-diacetamido-2,4,6-trideoxy-beta-L-altropyranose hydrolase